jgi:tetratricopeptide (TPR) repeat protein
MEYFSEWRTDLKIEGIPFIWSTNLTDEGIRDVFNTLLRQRFFIHLKDDGIARSDNSASGITYQIIINEKIFYTEIEYGDRKCVIVRTGENSVTVNCLTFQDYEELCIKQEEEGRKEEERRTRFNEHLNKHNVLTIKCRRLIESRMYHEAEKYCRSLLQLELESQFTSLRYAFQYLLQLYNKTKNIEAAFDLVNELQQCSQNLYPPAICQSNLLEFGHDYERDKEVELAEEIYLKLLNKFPEYGGVYKRLALMYVSLGRYFDAIEICNKAINLNLEDGTQGGFGKRIEKIRKKQAAFSLTQTPSRGLIDVKRKFEESSK